MKKTTHVHIVQNVQNVCVCVCVAKVTTLSHHRRNELFEVVQILLCNQPEGLNRLGTNLLTAS